MVAGELPFKLSLEPLAGFVVLAGGTMAVAAGSVDMEGLSTLAALVDGNPRSFGSALLDGIDGLSAPLGMESAKRSMYSEEKVRKISLIEIMVEAFHGSVDDPAGIFGSLLGEVEVDHGGLETGMPQVSLDDSRVHTGFEQMGGIAVTKGVN